MKIPSLLRLSSGTLLALAEARTPDCGDFSRTDLVMKRSFDNGTTWGPLRKLVNVSSHSNIEESRICGNPIVVGNAAPVQLSPNDRYHPNRILVPHMRNNYEVWITHSDDDGRTWSPARLIPGMVETFGASSPDCNRNMSYFGLKTASNFLEWVEELGWSNKRNDPFERWRKYMTGPWQFVGLGPPGAIQLRQSGRIVVPGYHSYIRGLPSHNGQGGGVALPVSQLYNNFALGHVIYSEDGGDTWELGSKNGLGGGADRGSMGANEDQVVQLSNGSLLLNSRSLATGSPQFRLQSISDDSGLTWSPSRFVEELPEPFNGCQGSIVSTDGGNLYLSHPNPSINHGIAPSILKLFGANVNLTGRDHMTIWRSTDSGAHYVIDRLVDDGAAGYSSLQEMPGDAGLFLLYEQSDREASSLGHLAADALIGALSVLNPDRMVFRSLSL